jgi:hypothetical protein
MAARVYARRAPRQLASRVAHPRNLEEHAIQRDSRFLFRLFVSLVIAAAGGLWIASHLTSHDTGTCAAGLFGAAAPPASSSTTAH